MAWLGHRGSAPQVAADLHVHPQTVRYRLAALKELLGEATLADPDARFELELALRARASAAPPRTADRAHPRRIDHPGTD